MTTFEVVHQGQQSVDGWLRPSQAEGLWKYAQEVPAGGKIVEIGSYHGKSTVILASASLDDVEVYAIDPHAGNDRAPGEWEGTEEDGQSDHEAFLKNLATNGVDHKVNHVREFSQKALHLVPGDIEMLYVDGAHGYAPALSDIEDWGGRVVDGGVMAIHDCYTSFFVTLALARSLWFSQEWTYLGRASSMTFFRRTPPSGPGLVTNPLRQIVNVPWFFKNMVAKALDMGGLGVIGRPMMGPDGRLY
jgi:hypothetical protein